MLKVVALGLQTANVVPSEASRESKMYFHWYRDAFLLQLDPAGPPHGCDHLLGESGAD